MGDSSPRKSKKALARPEPVATVSRTSDNKNLLLASPVHRGGRPRVSSMSSIDGMRPILLREPSHDTHLLTERHWRVVYRTLHVTEASKSTNKYNTTYRTYLMLNDDISGSRDGFDASAGRQARRIQGDSKRPATPRLSHTATPPDLGITTRYRTYFNLNANDESSKPTVYQRIFVSMPQALKSH
jgi:hypothetical protein